MATDDARVIAGTEEIEFRLIFNVPPGVDARTFMNKLAETVTVSVGMIGMLRETHADARKRTNVPKVVV